jgi:hypothetical protein
LCQIPKRILVGTRSKFLLVFAFIGQFCLNSPVLVVMKTSQLFGNRKTNFLGMQSHAEGSGGHQTDSKTGVSFGQ